MPEMTLQQGYQLAAEQHRAGSVREAEAFAGRSSPAAAGT